jgi:predicted Zn-dependent protease
MNRHLSLFLKAVCFSLALSVASTEPLFAQSLIPGLQLPSIFHKPTPTPGPKSKKDKDKKDDDKSTGKTASKPPGISLPFFGKPAGTGSGSNSPDLGKMIAGGITIAQGASGFSAKDEENIGDSVAIEIVADNGGLDEDPAINRRVVLIGRTLCHAVSYRTGFQFGVLNTDALNAFSAPGGWVFITRGLCNECTDAELAAIIGHEMRHIVHRDALQLISVAEILNGMEQVGSGYTNFTAFDGNVTSITRTILKVGFSHGQELAADSKGRDYAASVGFKKDALTELLTKLRDKYGNTAPHTDFGKPFPTHPSYNDRLANLGSK